MFEPFQIYWSKDFILINQFMHASCADFNGDERRKYLSKRLIDVLFLILIPPCLGNF